jgi:hypothetical protein
VSNRFALSEFERDRESVGLYVLLDFLTGSSIADLALAHDLGGAADTEALLRAVLLRHGYRAGIDER